MGLDGIVVAFAILALAIAVVGFPAYFWALDRRRRDERVNAVHMALTGVALVVTLGVAAWFLWPWARALAPSGEGHHVVRRLAGRASGVWMSSSVI